MVPLYNDSHSLEKGLREAHLVIGAVLIPGARAPGFITRDHLKLMKPGSVIVDVAIDRAAAPKLPARPPCRPGLRSRRHHPLLRCQYAGAYARTSTFASTNCTVKYGLQLANKGLERACRETRLARGLNLHQGRITFKPVAEAFGMEA